MPVYEEQVSNELTTLAPKDVLKPLKHQADKNVQSQIFHLKMPFINFYQPILSIFSIFMDQKVGRKPASIF